MRQVDRSRVRIHKLGKQRAGRSEVSSDPRGEAFCCLLHFILLIGLGNPGSQAGNQTQKDVKESQGES